MARLLQPRLLSLGPLQKSGRNLRLYLAEKPRDTTKDKFDIFLSHSSLDRNAVFGVVAELEQESLLAWAAEVAEEGVELQWKVSYIEAPLRKVTTDRVSWYAGHYLTTIAQARLSLATGGWGRWAPQWWKEREDEALGALRALRSALEEQESD